MKLIKSLFAYYLGMIAIFFVGRATLFALYFERFQAEDFNYWLAFLYGLRMDTIVASFVLLIPLAVLSLTPKILKGLANSFLVFYFLLVFLGIIYIENATFPFVAQYDVRPNYLFVEYLEYPKEVFDTITAEYKLELAIAFLMMFGFAWGYLRFMKSRNFLPVFDTHYMKRFALLFPMFIVLAFGVRSSFGHRPANISDAMFSPNRMVNEITKNSIYSIGYAVYANKKYSTDDISQYGEMDIKEAIGRVARRMNIEPGSDDAPLTRSVKSHFPTDKPKNLVIFIQESIGAQHVAATGGVEDITPNLNRLSKEGILFANLFSNGTRSIRGIAGVVAGNFSIPGRGVIKRNKSQHGFFTIASLLKPHGYYTQFIYGGESRFDNMRGWFLGNGFDEIIDQPKFVNPEWIGTWGVSDEDLAMRANEEFIKLHSQGQRFASVMFSTTNHSPFDIPPGKIELVEGVKEHSDTNTIKYADYAIGQFIEAARKEAYYQDTVIVIVSDHNIRVYGDDVVPVNMFHVPGLILGGGIEPRRIERLTTQPDVLATALDLTGLDLSYPIMGKSVFDETKNDFSLMQFNDFYALRNGEEVAVIRPNMEPSTFLYQDQKLVPSSQRNPELEKDALAFIVTLNHVYNKKLYKSP